MNQCIEDVAAGAAAHVPDSGPKTSSPCKGGITVCAAGVQHCSTAPHPLGRRIMVYVAFLSVAPNLHCRNRLHIKPGRIGQEFFGLRLQYAR